MNKKTNIDKIPVKDNSIKEFHLFAGIGGGIYGGHLLGHHCCGGVEIDEFCQNILKQRQKDGWLDPFEIYGDIKKLNGKSFKGKFDILCGGFPCQAFSTAAHGKNIASKNIWDEMFRFVEESNAPIVFGENVALKAILKAKEDLETLGYKVYYCKLSCFEIGGDHQRNRFWLLAVKNKSTFKKIAKHLSSLNPLEAKTWTASPHEIKRETGENVRAQLKAIGNAQSPFVAASAFRILVNRHIESGDYKEKVSVSELEKVFSRQNTWVKETFGKDFGLVHTPTTMANYSAPSMMKHQGCRNFVKVFNRPNPLNAEYLMGFPVGASSPEPQNLENIKTWNK